MIRACTLILIALSSLALGPHSAKRGAAPLYQGDRGLVPDNGPISNNLDTVLTERDAYDRIVAILYKQDSQGGYQAARYHGVIHQYLDRAATLIPMADFRFAGTRVRHNESGGKNWGTQTDESGNPFLTPGDRWASDQNFSDHYGFSCGYTKAGDLPQDELLFEIVVDRDKYDIESGSEVTFAFLYRMCANSNNIQLSTQPVGYQSDSTWDASTPSQIGTADVATYASGNAEVGVFSSTIKVKGGFQTTDQYVGFRVSINADQGEIGDNIELLGAVVFQSRQSLLEPNARVLDKAAGNIDLLLHKSGFSATSHLVFISANSQRALIDLVANIRGDGITPHPKPIDTVRYILGHNEDQNGYINGLSHIRSQVELDLFTPLGYMTPQHDFTAPWSTPSRLQRMRTQAQDLFLWTCANGDAFRSLYAFYNGLPLQWIAGLNPFGVVYPVYDMDIFQTHPQDTETASYIVADDFEIADPVHHEPNACDEMIPRPRR